MAQMKTIAQTQLIAYRKHSAVNSVMTIKNIVDMYNSKCNQPTCTQGVSVGLAKEMHNTKTLLLTRCSQSCSYAEGDDQCVHDLLRHI